MLAERGFGSGNVGTASGADWLSNEIANLSLFDGRLSSSMPGLADEDLARGGPVGGSHGMGVPAGMDFFGQAGHNVNGSSAAIFGHDHDGNNFGMLGAHSSTSSSVPQPQGANGPISGNGKGSKGVPSSSGGQLDSLSEHQGWPVGGNGAAVAPNGAHHRQHEAAGPRASGQSDAQK
jgi:hypothetical protein